jgi:hypothetical protein
MRTTRAMPQLPNHQSLPSPNRRHLTKILHTYTAGKPSDSHHREIVPAMPTIGGLIWPVVLPAELQHITILSNAGRQLHTRFLRCACRWQPRAHVRLSPLHNHSKSSASCLVLRIPHSAVKAAEQRRTIGWWSQTVCFRKTAWQGFPCRSTTWDLAKHCLIVDSTDPCPMHVKSMRCLAQCVQVLETQGATCSVVRAALNVNSADP